MGNSASIPLDDICEQFIHDHVDIAEKLRNIDLGEVERYLSDRQCLELQERIDNVIRWTFS